LIHLYFQTANSYSAQIEDQVKISR